MAKNKLPPDDIKFVMNLLRQGSVKWSGRAECLRRARKKVLEGKTKKGKAKYKFYWKCAKCKDWFRDESSMEVDHIIEIGPFDGCLNSYASKVFCRQENLQCLCTVCHMKKTMNFNSARSQWKRK